MKLYRLALPFTFTLLAACGPDKLLSDLASPNRQYHVEVRSCPTPGGAGDSAGTFQVSLLVANKSEGCGDDINSMAQFQTHAPVEQLQLEWLSDSQVRAWAPGFEQLHMPFIYSYDEKAPVHFVFAPRK